MKKSTTNPIDELMKDQFSNFNPEVSERVWENLAEDLNAQKNSIRKVYFFRIAIAAMVLFSIGTFFYYFNIPAPQSSPVANISGPSKTIRLEKTISPIKEMANTNSTETNKKEVRPEQGFYPPQIISNVQVVEPTNTITSTPVETTPKTDELIEPATIATTEITLPTQEVVTTKKLIQLNSVANVIQTLVNKIDKRNEKIIDIKRAENTGSLSINLGLIKIKHSTSIN